MDLTDWTLAFMEDASGRRGIWYKKTPLKEEQGYSLEICGGREGDDYYVQLYPRCPVSSEEMEQLIDCLNTQRWVREEKLHIATCERKADPVVSELLKELSESALTNNALWDKVWKQQGRINDLLWALAEKPELARYAVVERLRAENKQFRNKIEQQAEEIDALKRTLTKRQERAEGVQE